MGLLKSEWLKIKHTPLGWLHLAMPVLGAVIFVAYSGISGWDTTFQLTFYFEALSLAFPLLIGIVTGLSAEQEQMAGAFQNMLSVTAGRTKVLMGKLLVLLLLGFLALALGIGLYGLGFWLIPGHRPPEVGLYVGLLIALFSGNLFLYFLHMLVSLYFGKAASIGLGVVGSLLAALMLTGLGDGIWSVTPWAWSVRFCELMIGLTTEVSPDIALGIRQALALGTRAMLPMVVAMGAILVLWFRRYEGGNNE